MMLLVSSTLMVVGIAAFILLGMNLFTGGVDLSAATSGVASAIVSATTTGVNRKTNKSVGDGENMKRIISTGVAGFKRMVKTSAPTFDLNGAQTCPFSSQHAPTSHLVPVLPFLS
jgi:hypothetical protein